MRCISRKMATYELFLAWCVKIASFAVKGFQLQKNMICIALLRLYMKINVVFLKGSYIFC
jgi:hypothetical protein